MILAPKDPQTKTDELGRMESDVLYQLTGEIPHLSSVYFIPSDQMVQAPSILDITSSQASASIVNYQQRTTGTFDGAKVDNILDLDFNMYGDTRRSGTQKYQYAPSIDLLGDDDIPS